MADRTSLIAPPSARGGTANPLSLEAKDGGRELELSEVGLTSADGVPDASDEKALVCVELEAAAEAEDNHDLMERLGRLTLVRHMAEDSSRVAVLLLFFFTSALLLDTYTATHNCLLTKGFEEKASRPCARHLPCANACSPARPNATYPAVHR